MHLPNERRAAICVLLLAALSGCRGATSTSPVPATPELKSASAASFVAHAGRLGVVLTSKDKGQIFGFDVNQHGTDGIFTTAKDLANGNLEVSMDTFDQGSGAITGSFANQIGTVNSFSVDGIFAGDTALVTHFVIPY